MPSKILLARVLSALRSAMDRFSFSFLGKTAIRKTGNLSLRQIYTTLAPPLSPFPACDPDLSKSARSTHQVSAFRVSRNQCYDVRTLLLAKEFVGNREVSRRFDNRLHNSLVLHWTPSVKYNCMPLDTTAPLDCDACTSPSRQAKTAGNWHSSALTIAQTSASFPLSRPFPAAILAPRQPGSQDGHSERSRKHGLGRTSGPLHLMYLKEV
jgi:hypothetical protein